MSDTVLVTGGFGLVGSQTVTRLAADGRPVVAADLPTPGNRKAADALPSGAEARWADLTDADEVGRLVSEVSPAVIVHLAAVIPPPIYRNTELGRKVNVDATATLVRVAEAQPTPPRFVLASSNAVYGARNPHHCTAPIHADDAPRPTEVYGGHKLEAENLVRSSSLEWVVLRLGAVLTPDLTAMPLTGDSPYIESALPTDGRVHTVDVRDVAAAFAAATTADVTREVLLVAGDNSHWRRQAEVGAALTGAWGLAGLLPPGRPGDPDSDEDWFITDWMDTTRAQQVLRFQHHSWPDMLAEMRAKAGWARYPLQLVAPVVVPVAREFLKRRSAHRDTPGQYADPWGAVRAKLGDPGLDST